MIMNDDPANPQSTPLLKGYFYTLVQARVFGYRRVAMRKWRISGPHMLSLVTFSYQAGNGKTQKENGWFQTL